MNSKSKCSQQGWNIHTTKIALKHQKVPEAKGLCLESVRNFFSNVAKYTYPRNAQARTKIAIGVIAPTNSIQTG